MDEMDDIYELTTGDFIDISNLVTVGKVIFDRCAVSDDNWLQGYIYFECRFRFIKDPVKFFEGKLINGVKEDKEKELEERKEIFETEHLKLISAWRKHKRNTL